jgi:Fe-S oxidoreductase
VNINGTAIMNHALNGRVTCKIKGGKGSKSKLNEEIAKRLIKAFKNDMPIVQACTLAGISKETYNQWKNNYPDFADQIKRARLSFIETAAKSIKLGMITDWRAGAWVKERRDKRYKDKKEVELKGKPILIQDVIVLKEYNN